MTDEGADDHDEEPIPVDYDPDGDGVDGDGLEDRDPDGEALPPDALPGNLQPQDVAARSFVRTHPTGHAEPPIMVGGIVCPAGARTHVQIPVGRLPTETWLSVPVEVVRGAQPGPSVWLTAAIHGDEINGVDVIRRVLGKLDCETLRGTVLAVPIVNVFGFNARSRYLPDRRDLNRSFPGSPSGSLASQLARLLMTEIVAHADVGLDLHTGSDHRFNLPQIRANLEDGETLRLAEAFHAPITMHSAVRDGSLRGAATALGKPVLLYEAGEPQRFNGECIKIGVRGVMNVLRALDMLPPRSAESQAKRPDTSEPSIRVPSSAWVRAKRSGIFRPIADLGARVAEGDRLGGIADAFGRNRSSLRAPFDGVVIARANNPLVHRGDGVVHLGRVDDAAGERREGKGES